LTIPAAEIGKEEDRGFRRKKEGRARKVDLKKGEEKPDNRRVGGQGSLDPNAK